MAGVGAPLGNQYAAKAKIVTNALQRALAQEDWKRLHQGCDKIAKAFAAGEPWAVQYVSDRLDGKPAQSVEVDPNADGRLVISWISAPVSQQALTIDAQVVDSAEKVALPAAADPPGAP